MVFAVFLVSQRRVRDPILDLRIFSNRNLSAASGVNLLVGFCIMVALVSVPILINVAGAANTMKAALVTGYLLCAFTVPMALAAIPGGWLSERLGYRSTVVLGLITAIVGFWMMSLWKVEMAAQAVTFFDSLRHGPSPADARGTGFMAAGVKAAAFGGILRLLSTAFGSPLLVAPDPHAGWASILSVLAAGYRPQWHPSAGKLTSSRP